MVGSFSLGETCFGIKIPELVDHWVVNEEFDAEETAGYMPFSPDTWSDGNKIQDHISKVDIAGAGVKDMCWVLLEIVRLGIIWISLQMVTGMMCRTFGRFLPCGTSGNHCRLHHLGREQCGHGLSSRPGETADPRTLNPSLQLFGASLRCCF